MDQMRCHELTITSRPAGEDALKAAQTALRHFNGNLMFDPKGVAARRSFLTRRFFASWSMEVQMRLYIKTVVLDKRMGSRRPVCGVYPTERDYRRKGRCDHVYLPEAYFNPRTYIGRKNPPVYKYF